MPEIQELHAESPALLRRRMASWGRPMSVLISIVGGFCGAIVLSMLLSHPAGAAPLQAVSGQAGSLISSPVVSKAVQGSTAANVVPPVIDPVVPQVTRLDNFTVPALPITLSTVVGTPVSILHSTPLPVVTTLLPVVTTTPPEVLGNPSSSTPAMVVTMRSAATQGHPFPTLRVLPMPDPGRKAPAHQNGATAIDATPDTSSTSSSSSSSFGISPIAGHLSLGLLLPAPMSTGLPLGNRKTPEHLLDLRDSPPG